MQNNVPHCCVIKARELVVEWLDAVVVRRRTRINGVYGFIKMRPSDAAECPDSNPPAVPIWCRGAKDTWGAANWGVSAAQTAAQLHRKA